MTEIAWEVSAGRGSRSLVVDSKAHTLDQYGNRTLCGLAVPVKPSVRVIPSTPRCQQCARRVKRAD